LRLIAPDAALRRVKKQVRLIARDRSSLDCPLLPLIVHRLIAIDEESERFKMPLNCSPHQWQSS
jgi:hypothetical protein